MAEGNNFILDIVASFQAKKSQMQLNSDIKSIQKQLDKLELKAEIDPKSITNLKKKIEAVKVKAELAPDAIQNLVKQLESIANQKITISNINVDQAQTNKAGQQIGNGINKSLSASLNSVKHNINSILKDFGSQKLKSYDLSKMFNLNRKSIESSVIQQVRNLTNELNALAKEALKTNSDSAWTGITNKLNSLSGVLNQFGKSRDLSSFKESLDILNQLQGKKIFVNDKSELLQNTGMGIRELNSQFKNLGVTFTTVSKNATHLETIWSELFNISPNLQQFTSFGDQVSAIVNHLKIAKEAMYGESNLQPLNGQEITNALSGWMNNLDNASKKLGVLRSEQSAIEQQIAKQSSVTAENVANDEKKKQDAYKQTANVQKQTAEQTKQTGAAYQVMGDTASNAIKKVESEQANMGTQSKSVFASLKQSMSFLSYWASPMYIMIQAITKVKQAFSELKEINTIMTEISKVSNMTSNELKKLGESAFEAASKYGKKASDYLTGIQEFSRAGFRGKDAENMAELSVLTQAAGDLDADLANKYLIATDAAFKLNGEASKLNEILDGQNYIANNNATSMEHLANATKVAASQAASAGVDVEEMSAAIGTMVSVTQDSGEVAGRAFKAILMNLQQVSGELDDGEVIDEESLTKYEKACNELGVSLKEVKDGVVSLRDPMQILKELSEAYTSLDKMDARRANLISAIGGKHRGNQLNALLENWSTYEKMLTDYSNGSGSAMNEAMKSANNWEGSLNRLHNTWVNTVENIANSDAIITIINGANSLLKVLDTLTSKLGSVGTIGVAAFAFLNKGKIKNYIKNFKIQITDIQKVIMEFDKINLNYSALTGNQLSLFKEFKAEELQSYVTQLQAIKASSRGLFDVTTAQSYASAISGLEAKQAALLLSTQGLTNAQIAETLAVNESNVAKNYQAMVDAGLLSRKQTLTAAQVQENLQTVLGAEADTSAAMASLGLSAAIECQEHQTVQLTAKKLQEMVATNALTEAQAQELAMRTGVTLSMNAQSRSIIPKWISSIKAGTTAILKQVKATAVWLATTPAGWASLAVVAIGGVIAALNHLAKEEKKASDAAIEAYEKTQEKVRNNKEEAKSLQELIKKYEELKKSSNIDSDIREEIKELQFDIADLVGSEAQNLDLVNGKLDEELVKLKNIAAEKARQNLDDARDNYYKAETSANKMTGNYDDYGNDAKISESELYELLGIEYDTAKGNYIDTEGNTVYWGDLLKTFKTDFSDIVRDSKNIFSRDIVIDTTEIDSIEDKIKRLEEFKDFIRGMGLNKSELYSGVVNAIDYYKEQYGNELESADTLVDSLIVDLSKSNNDLNKISVDSMKSFEEYRNNMINEILKDDDVSDAIENGFLSKESIQTSVDNFIATCEEFSVWYERWQEEINNTAKEQSKTNPTSFSFRFQTLWDSETFSDAKADLMKLAKESKITEEDIQSLAKENSELASLLNESGISAQFAAACFNRVSDGTDGFSAITEDALALDKALHGMDESLQNVAASKSAYDKGMEQDDYNAEFKDYQEAYEQAMEMFENGEYGKHFQSSMLYLLGDDAVNMSIEEMKSAMDGLKSVFGENATNGLEFLDKLYEKKDILDGMSSSLEKLEDGSYKFDLKPEEFEKIADALGMTTEQVAACTNALGMFGDYASYDIDKVNNALSEMSIAVKDGEDSILSLQSVKDMLSNMGYDEWDIVKIMQDIQEMGNIKLIDFSATDAESIKSAVSYLQQLEMIEIDGSNINVDSLIEHLRNELGMLPEEIKGFLTNLDVDYDFSDTEGNIIALDKAFEKVDEQEMKSVTGEIEETDEAIQDATVSADGLKDVLDDISHLSLESLRSQVIGVKDAIGEVREAAKTASSVLGNLSGNITLASDGGTSGNGTQKGTLKKGSATAAGNFNINKTGTAKATGDIGAKKTEDVLLNELGNETVIDPESGTYEIIQGGAQFRKIKKGQIILNHLQTKALLAKGKISSFGKMMFGGNAALKGHSYAAGTAGGTNPATGKPFSGNGSNSSTSKKSSTSSTNSDADSISDSAKESLETFNFIEIAISRIEDAIDKLKEKAEETFQSFTNRGKAYSESIAKITEEISLQEQAYNAYMARANSYGLDEAWAAQVRNGSINIADISDDALKEQISSYQEWYDKAYECLKVIEELKKNQKELAQQKIELQVTKYGQKITKADSNVERIQNYVDLKETYGGNATAAHYSTMNKYTQQQIGYTIKQNNSLKALQETVEKGSEAWYEYQQQIDSNNNSIKQLTISMAENAAAAASVAAQTAERKNEKEDTADEKIDAKLSTTSNREQTKRLLRSKITNIDDRQENYGDAYSASTKKRVSYGNKIANASTKGVSSKNKKLFDSAKSYVKKKKAIPAKVINDIVNAMKTAEGNEYKSLETFLSYCNYYNAYINAEEENRQNYEMYALTAQAEKSELRQEQLQANLDYNQTKAGRNTMSTAETAAGKNHNVDVNVRLANANATSYKNSRIKYELDRDAAGKKADFSSTKTFKGLKDEKLKARLQKAVNAIKAGKTIDDDSLKAVSEYCKKYLNGNMTYYNNCEAYNQSVENVLDAKEAEALANAEAYATKLQAKREKAANTVAGRDSQNELYSAAAANQTTAGAKNAYVNKQIANISNNLQTYKNDYNDAVKDYNDAKRIANKIYGNGKTKEQQSIIKEIKSKYVNKDILIPASYIQKAYSVSTEFGLACEEYNEALENKNVAKETYEMYEQTAKTEKATLALEKMTNIKNEYSNKQGVYEQRATRLNNAIDLAQAKGYEVSKVYYNRLIQEESAINSSLASERQSLINSLNESVANGNIVKYTDSWYEACAAIDDVTNSLDESTKSLVEFQNQLRQIEWDNFDYLENHIKNVNSEISFLVNELSREDLASDEIGRLTDRGNAAAVLRAESYESYQKQAKDYADEIEKINKDLAKDPYNKTLLDRREELVQSYQDCIKGAQDEKYAIIELYEQGYEALLAKIKKLISEYEDLLDAEKDAYDYQNDIADKTKEIANLRKQLQAYAGDISEETRTKVQQLKVSLEEAEKDLAETQYDKYISDTKEMLSDLEEDMEEAIQAIIDSLSENFDRLLKDIDSNYKDACETIKAVSDGIGYTSTEDFKTLLDNTKISSAVTSMLDEIKNLHKDMTANADNNANNIDYKTTGYASGSKRIPHDQMAWTQENGGEMIYRSSDGAILTPLGEGDMVFTNEMSRRLWEFGKSIVPGQGAITTPDITKNVTINLPKAEPVRNAGDITINMGGITMNEVNDMDAFEAKLVDAVNNSTRVKKVVSNSVLGPLTNGYNSLSGRRYSVH